MGKAMKSQPSFLHPPRTSCLQASELPAKKHPTIFQHRPHRQQEEADGGITRGVGRAYPAQQAVAALDPKAPPIPLIDLLHKPRQLK